MVLGTGVCHSVLGMQLEKRKVVLPEVYGMMLLLGFRHVEIVRVKTCGVGGGGLR